MPDGAGADSAGLVEPTVWRTAATAFGPSHTIAITGAEVMYWIKPS